MKVSTETSSDEKLQAANDQGAERNEYFVPIVWILLIDDECDRFAHDDGQ